MKPRVLFVSRRIQTPLPEGERRRWNAVRELMDFRVIASGSEGDREFRLALGRSRADAYATLERGAIASSQGNRATAIALLERAVHLEPREDLARDALRATRAGRRVDVDKLNRLILVKARELR